MGAFGFVTNMFFVKMVAFVERQCEEDTNQFIIEL
jgi:hypothetical protein